MTKEKFYNRVKELRKEITNEELAETGEEKALSEKEKTNDLWKPQEQFAFFWKEDVRNAVDMEELLLERFILGLITQQRFWKERKEIFGDLK